jgi:hypothetical protein
MAVLPSRLFEWAAGRSPDRIVAVGVLAVRVRPYLSDGASPPPGSIPGLHVRAAGFGEVPLWHESTGIYGFLRLPPGQARIEVEDPARRFLAQAVPAAVPDRGPVRDALQSGQPVPTGSPGYGLVDVLLRPSAEMAFPPASTAVWGVLRESADGRPIAGALLTFESLLNGAADTVTTLSGPDGSYLAALPGEVLDRSTNPPIRGFDRALTVDAPLPPLAEALATQGFLAGQPAGPFRLTMAERLALYADRRFQLRAEDGSRRPHTGGQNPLVPVSIGLRVRWDIELLP